ncbi:polysaccharide biosynthesis tyrosine autokinase [soil metagenome]
MQDSNEWGTTQGKSPVVVRAHEMPVRYRRTFVEPEPTPGNGEANLQAYWRILRDRWQLAAAVFVLTLAAVAAGTWLQTPIYRATGTLEIRRQAEQVVPAEAGFQTARINDQHLETEYQVLTSPTLAALVVAEMQSSLGSGAAVLSPTSRVRTAVGLNVPGAAEVASANFAQRLRIDPARGSRLVRISFDSEDPELAAWVVDAVFAHYTQLRVEAARTAELHLASQADSVRLQLLAAEQQLQGYMRGNDLFFLENSSGDSENILHERLRRLQQQLTEVEVERYAKQSQYNLVQQQGVESLSSDALRTLSVRSAELRGEYSRLRTTFSEDYPRVQQLKSQLDDLDSQITRERQRVAVQINRDYAAALRNQELLDGALREEKAQLEQAADKAAEYQRLQRDLANHQDLYSLLQKRRQEAGVAAALAATEVGIVHRPVAPGHPVRPVPARNLKLAVLLGLLLGVGAMCIREYTDTTINTVEELDGLSPHPVLGMIPSVTNAASGLRGALLAEAFGSLRTSILMGVDSLALRSLMITSAQPQEGKTTISVNLATSLAKLGGRVLLVDADIRRPATQRVLGTATADGLVNVLEGKVGWRSVVQANVLPGLDVLPSGQPPKNAAELLASSRMRQFADEARADYDFVIFDAPAILINAADSRILAPLADATVFVIRSRVTPRDLARRALRQVPNTLGVVLNDLNVRQFTSYYRDYMPIQREAPAFEPHLPVLPVSAKRA